jgi:hypothetical protein
MTTRERLEAKLEKREAWAVARRESAHAGFESAHKLVENIPLGQPILVGHHSEKAARNLYKRVEQKSMGACESLNMAEHHESKAEGIRRALDKNIFSDDENALDRLQERIAELEKKQAAMVAVNKICRNKKIDQAEKEKQIRESVHGIDERTMHEIFNPVFTHLPPGFPSFSLSNNNANINRLKKRLVDVQCRQKRAEIAEKNGGVAITGNETYICVTFSEKPEYDIIRALKEAGFYWSRGSWRGERAKLPESVANLENE